MLAQLIHVKMAQLVLVQIVPVILANVQQATLVLIAKYMIHAIIIHA